MNVVITGSTSGLGLELSKLLLAAGHCVAGISRSPNLVIQNSNYQHFEADIKDRTRILEVSQLCHFSAVDLIINNAGLPGSGRRIAEVEPAEVQDLLDVNLFGSLNLVQCFLDKLRSGATKRIVNISSRFGSLAFNQEPDNKELKISYSYRISKAAQNMLAVCLSNELKEEGITVDVIHPGSFRSNSGRPDATLTAREAAQRIVRWLEQGPRGGETRLKEIDGREFSW